METLDDFFRKTVEDRGSNPAVRTPQGTLSYADFEGVVQNFAAGFRGAGLINGARVGVSLERGPLAYAALLACWRVGAIPLMMGTQNPPRYLATVWRRASADCLLIDADRDSTPLLEELREVNAARSEMLEVASLFLHEPLTQRDDRAASSASSAYILPTSGSTGEPKLVEMTHASLTNLVCWHIAQPSSGIRVTAQLCEMTFDFSFGEIFSTLCGGGTLVLPAPGVTLDPVALASWIEREAVDRLFLPVPLLRALTGQADRLGLVKEIFTTGEPVRLDAPLRSLLGRSGAVLNNQYGASEFQDATSHRLLPGCFPESGTLAAGTPLPGVKVTILNPETGTECPPDVPGEVVIGGVGLAAGYVTHDHPSGFFTDHTGERWYRTADIGSQDSTGVLTIFGRFSDFLKVSGHRIDPRAVERVILSTGSVSDAIVSSEPDDEPIRVVAHLKVDHEEDIDDAIGAIKRSLTELPSAWAPTRYYTHGELPTTSSGKTQRRGLKGGTLVWPRQSREQDFESSKNGEDARRLIDLARRVTGLDYIQEGASWSELGLSSLESVSLCQQISGLFGTRVAYPDLHEFPTVKDLADHITRTRGREPGSASALSVCRAPLTYPEMLTAIEVADALIHDSSTAFSAVVGWADGEPLAAALAGVLTAEDAWTITQAISTFDHQLVEVGSGAALDQYRATVSNVRPNTHSRALPRLSRYVRTNTENLKTHMFWESYPLLDVDLWGLQRWLSTEGLTSTCLLCDHLGGGSV